MLTWLTTTFLGKFLSTLAISMVPIIELRGGLPYGVGMGLDPWTAFIAAVIGNMIPVPFIILFIRHIFEFLKKHDNKLSRLVIKLEEKAHVKGRVVQKYSVLGLCILVAIPLPGTGAWTGALVAAILDMRLRKAVPTILLGVIIAGLIVLFITYGFTLLF